MNHKIKRKWCASLRSGQWTQLKGQYHDEAQGRCAVGVLRDVLGSKWIEWFVTNLPDGKRCQIERMNDRGASLSDIADWIEDNL